jgi:hypothetical protein
MHWEPISLDFRRRSPILVRPPLAPSLLSPPLPAPNDTAPPEPERIECVRPTILISIDCLLVSKILEDRCDSWVTKWEQRATFRLYQSSTSEELVARACRVRSPRPRWRPEEATTEDTKSRANICRVLPSTYLLHVTCLTRLIIRR